MTSPGLTYVCEDGSVMHLQRIRRCWRSRLPLRNSRRDVVQPITASQTGRSHGQQACICMVANNHDGDVHRRNQNAQTFYVHTRFSEVFLSSLCPSNSSCGSSARWLRGSDAGGRTRPGEQVGSLPPPPGHPEGLRAFSWGPGGGEPQPAAALGVAGAPVSSTAGVSGSSAPRSPNAQPISVAREDPGPRTP